MSGDWIKMRGNLWDDPRVSRLVDMTDSSEAAVVGALYWLWATADQHTEDGILPGLTVKGINRKTGVEGFAEALIAVGWLADHPEGVRIVNFEEHNGASAKSRAQTAKRVSNHKANAKVTQAPLPEQQDTVSTALPREEKRREEERDTQKPGDFCPQQEIIDLYHAELPTARRIREWTPTRQALLRTRWREKDERQTLDWWQKFFAYVAKSDFLCGRSPVQAGRKPFELSLDWLCKSENFVKVLEGAYES